MTMSLTGPRFTYEDYKLLPEDKRYEIIEGELLVTPAPNTRHQKILLRLVLKLGTWAQDQGVGTVLYAPTDVILSDENVVQPDILFVVKEREGIVDPNGGINGAPDLVVEALSPSTASRDQVLKRKLYSKYGVREYWIVDPVAHSIEVLSFMGTGLETWQVFTVGSTLVSPLLPGLQVSTSQIFVD
jgi:Uma2 family endonuclease